jgi:hypothetical protein
MYITKKKHHFIEFRDTERIFGLDSQVYIAADKFEIFQYGISCCPKFCHQQSTIWVRYFFCPTSLPLD